MAPWTLHCHQISVEKESQGVLGGLTFFFWARHASHPKLIGPEGILAEADLARYAADSLLLQASNMCMNGLGSIKREPVRMLSTLTPLNSWDAMLFLEVSDYSKLCMLDQRERDDDRSGPP
jgi:hypothetical protein